MPIRVTCPSCGRAGRVPDNAVGRNVACPACQHRYVLKAEGAVPDGLELLDDDEATVPLAPVAEALPLAPVAPRRPEPAAPREAVGGSRSKAPLYAAVAGGVGTLLGVSAAVGLYLAGGRTPEAQPPAARSAPTPLATTPPIQAATNPPVQAASANPVEVVPAAARTNGAADLLAAGTKPATAPKVETAPAPAPATPKDESPGKTLSTAEIVAESEPSIALVKGKASSGTGFLVRPGIVATNAHVIDDEFVSNLEVRFPSADEAREGPVSAELLYEDAKRDLAFLAVKTDLPGLRVAPSYAFRKGEDVTVIGNPGLGGDLVLENAISRGVMSTKATLDGQNFYQLGVAINPGNSGGPVFDSSGRVIGVATLKTSKQEALAFCIPAEDLQAALVRLDRQSPSDAEKVRSRHRVVNAVKGMGTGGAVYCVGIDLRRASAAGASVVAPELPETLKKIEAAITELDKDLFASLTPELPGVKADPLLDKVLKGRVDEMAANFSRIKAAYGKAKTRSGVDDATLRRMKSTHKRLITDLSRTLGLETPAEMLTVFDDRPTPGPSHSIVLGVVPPSAGSLRERLQGRRPTSPPTSGSRLRGRSRNPGQ